MINDLELLETFRPALTNLRNKEFRQGCAEFERAFAAFEPPPANSSVWTEILGAYLACCFALCRRPQDLVAFKVPAFLNAQDLQAVSKFACEYASAFEANAKIEIPPYVFTVAGPLACASEAGGTVLPNAATTASTRTAIHVTIWAPISVTLRSMFR